MTQLVVVGDALLDIDIIGEANRLSPEAPVPVVGVARERARPGGAALSALLAARDGHHVTLIAALADDPPAAQLRMLLADAVDLVPLPRDGATVIKRRVRVDGQSLLRLDTGDSGRIGVVPPEASAALSAAEAVLVSDYGHGVCAVPELRRLLSGLALAVPVVWDPHQRGPDPVAGVRLATPNLAEARTFAERHGAAGPANGIAAVTAWADGLLHAWQASAVAVTRGEHGALLSYGQGVPAFFPAPPVVGGDRNGAGDQFAVTAASWLGAGAVTAEAVQAAVVSASEFVARGGAAAVLDTRSRSRPAASGKLGDVMASAVAAAVRARGGIVVATGGCFDLLHPGHVATLRAARRLGDCLVVCLNSDASVRRLKGPGRPLMRAADRAVVLAALECVDAVVVFDDDTPTEVMRSFRPDIWAKGGDYAGADLPEVAVLSEWGGQAVTVPYVDGHSTAGLVRTAARGGPSHSWAGG